MNHEQLLSLTEANTKAIAELRASIAEAHASIVELRASTAEAHARWEQKFAAEERQRQEDRQRWAEFMQTYGNYVDNQGRKVEDFFIQGIRKNNLRVGALEFDDIFPTATRANKRRGTLRLMPYYSMVL